MKFKVINGTWRFISWTIWHSLRIYLTSCLSIILSLAVCLPNCLIPSEFWPKFCIHIQPPHACYDSIPSSSPWFDHL
jgi:hypothetical protein